MTNLIDVRSSVVSTAGELAAKFEQELPQEFLDDCKERRKDSDAAPIGNFLHAFRVPVVFVEQMIREGINVYSNDCDAKDIERWLRKNGLEVFILTKRSI